MVLGEFENLILFKSNFVILGCNLNKIGCNQKSSIVKIHLQDTFWSTKVFFFSKWSTKIDVTRSKITYINFC